MCRTRGRWLNKRYFRAMPPQLKLVLEPVVRVERVFWDVEELDGRLVGEDPQPHVDRLPDVVGRRNDDLVVAHVGERHVVDDADDVELRGKGEH